MALAARTQLQLRSRRGDVPQRQRAACRPCPVALHPHRQLLAAQHQQRARLVQQQTAAVQADTDAQAAQPALEASDGDDAPPRGCSRYTVSLKKPLGLVLQQDSTGRITIAEIAPEGAADKTGLCAVGDQLIATSGVTYAKEADYGGAMVKMGQQVVRLKVAGESFKTVSAAIGSHPGHMEVKLEFQRC